MTNAVSAQAGGQKGSLNRAGVMRIITVVLFMSVQGVLLFAFAGHLDWWNGWLYIGLYALTMVVNLLTFGRKNPELVNARGRIGEGTKGFDKVFAALYAPLPLIAMVVAGLDAGVSGWSPVATGWVVAGFVVMLAGYVIMMWAVNANTHFETTVRIQQDREHKVITGGPYGIVRHPGYLGMVLSWLGTPLILGSWWTLVPAALGTLLLVVRTALEDRTLQAELAGYAEFALKTRYRLLPLVW